MFDFLFWDDFSFSEQLNLFIQLTHVYDIIIILNKFHQEELGCGFVFDGVRKRVIFMWNIGSLFSLGFGCLNEWSELIIESNQI